MQKFFTNLGVIAVLAMATSNVFASEASERGKLIYQGQCAACHSIDYNGVGPAHKGVFGRKAGGAENYPYSEALKRSAVVWNEKTLDKWLTDPEKFIPGQKMGIQVGNENQRADLIAYLKLATGK